MSMINEPTVTRFTIGGGTCIKIGFLCAFGAFLFGLILSVVLGIVALIVGALGYNLFSSMLNP